MIKPVPLTSATALLIHGDTWRVVKAGTLVLVLTPTFTNEDLTGLVPAPEPWVSFVEDVTNVPFAAPWHAVDAVKLAAPVTPA